MTRAPLPTIPNWPLHRKHSDRSIPTIGILSMDEPTRDRIAGIVRHVGHSHPVESWSELFNTLSTIDCVVIDVAHSELPWAAWATLAGELSVPTEIVLIVPPDLSYLRLLARIRVFAVLTSDELHTALVETIRAVLRPAVLEAFATHVHKLEHLPISLRTALLVACEWEAPITSVNRLASLAGCSPSNLQRQWRTAANGGVRLQDFLNWVLVVRAHERHAQSLTSWAQTTGIPPRRIRRWMRRLRVVLEIDDEKSIPIHGGGVILRYLRRPMTETQK